ncbi:TPA: MFS transporter [Staphylococcus delphini]|uniref:MFS transporter n=1 Tax=Staphylococcus delphini TaxID=53344 RepID=UPI000BBC0D5E|nr:MFS transporter [Staphylococcus delphini]PCF46217.1 MFS transporter [Staphylococcus delphini]PCF74452.1 MFS transporter [Staphylococcus delphini]HEC2156445.1 MFS transporter [Staphylococcus delphini]HEC2175489.1 MFS transporter [Staphylococcus delphini]
MQEKLWSKDFIFITLTNFLMYMIHYMLIVTVTVFTINEFHTSESIGGLASGIFIIGMLIGRLASGRIVDAIQPKTVLVYGVIFSIVTVALYFVIQTLALLLIVRFIHGIAFGFSSTATGAISSRIVPEARKGEGIGYYALSVTTASAVGPFLGILFNQSFGFRSIFTLGLGVIILAFVLAVALKPLPQVETSMKSTPLKGIGAFIQKDAMPLSFVLAVIGVAYSSVLSFLSVYTETMDLPTAASIFFIVYAISAFVTRPFTGKIFDQHGHNAMMYPVIIIFAIGLVILSSAQGTWLIALSAIFIGIGYGTIVPSGQAIVVQQAPRHQVGLATSTFYIFLDFGAGFGPFLLGYIISMWGFQTLYVAMAILALIALVLYYVVHGRHVAQHSK